MRIVNLTSATDIETKYTTLLSILNTTNSSLAASLGVLSVAVERIIVTVMPTPEPETPTPENNTTTEPLQFPDKEKKLSGGAIAGIVVGSAAFVTLVGAGAVLGRRHYKKEEKEAALEEANEEARKNNRISANIGVDDDEHAKHEPRDHHDEPERLPPHPGASDELPGIAGLVQTAKRADKPPTEAERSQPHEAHGEKAATVAHAAAVAGFGIEGVVFEQPASNAVPSHASHDTVAHPDHQPGELEADPTKKKDKKEKKDKKCPNCSQSYAEAGNVCSATGENHNDIRAKRRAEKKAKKAAKAGAGGVGAASNAAESDDD